MKILQVITLLSEDGAFGGPFAVAWDQCSALHELGHDVTLVTGWDGVAAVPPAGFEVVPIRVRSLVPGLGVTGLFSVGLLSQVRRRARTADVVHVHMGRDAVSVLSARIIARHARTYIQCHGMVMPDQRLRARLVDRVATRTVLGNVCAAFYLTEAERQGLTEISAGRTRLVALRNGISSTTPPYRARESPGIPPTVLFCARLHERKRVMAFAAMAAELEGRRPGLRYLVAGPDEGDLPALNQFMRDNATIDLTYLGALNSAEARTLIAAADVYVLPSVNEPFPMTVLEALATGTPTVLTTSCGIAPELAATRAARVTDGSPAEMADATYSLLADVESYREQSARGRASIEKEFSIEAVARELLAEYQSN